MSRFLCYGEDGLTLWALTDQLKKTLSFYLKDTSRPEDSLVIYRPSFGRKGGSGSEFGEFDAILSTPKTIYLIESKWIRQKNKQLLIKKVQTTRHSVFKWYFNEIDGTVLEGSDNEWDDFRSKHNSKIDKIGKAIPGSGTELAKNIRKVLKELKSDRKDKNIKNVLLLFINDNIARPKVKFEPKEEKFEEPIWVSVKHEGWEEMGGR